MKRAPFYDKKITVHFSGHAADMGKFTSFRVSDTFIYPLYIMLHTFSEDVLSAIRRCQSSSVFKKFYFSGQIEKRRNRFEMTKKIPHKMRDFKSDGLQIICRNFLHVL